MAILKIEVREMSYKRRIGIGGLIFICIIFFGWKLREKEEILLEPREENKAFSEIRLRIEGEVAKECEMVYHNPLTYGSLIYKIQTICTKYSDLSGFDLNQTIDSSRTIVIPTLDKPCNSLSQNRENIININLATKEELMQLDHIGDKRSEEILEYISQNGVISSWDVFWRVASVPKKAWESIMQKATLQ